MDPMRHVDSVLSEVAHGLPYGIITPLNMVSFRKKAPTTFSYDSFDASSTLETLSAMSVPKKHIATKLFEEKIQELKDKAVMLGSIGTDSFAEASEKVYPVADKHTVDAAYTYMEIPDAPLSEHISRWQARKMLRSCFKELGFSWQIRNEQMTTSARVDPVRRILLLRRKERFRKRFVERLIVHEIGTHAIRAENGCLQPYAMFVHGFPGYLDTEEGLAAFNEEQAGILEGATLKNYAGRVLAVDYAKNHCFHETYRFLRTYFSAKIALKLTFRAKRGMPSTDSLGAFTRDASYLRGYLKVKEFAKKQWVPDLYMGKIGIEHVRLVKKMPDVIPARHTPQAIIRAFSL